LEPVPTPRDPLPGPCSGSPTRHTPLVAGLMQTPTHPSPQGGGAPAGAAPFGSDVRRTFRAPDARWPDESPQGIRTSGEYEPSAPTSGAPSARRTLVGRTSRLRASAPAGS